MTETHWKKIYNPDFLGSWDVGEDGIIATIRTVRKDELYSQEKKKKEPLPVLDFIEDIKPMVVNKTNGKTLQKMSGSPYIEKWAGLRVLIKSVRVRAFGEMVDSLSISTAPEKQQARELICSDCGKPVTAFGQITAAQVAATNKARYGREICADCSTKLKEAAARATERQ